MHALRGTLKSSVGRCASAVLAALAVAAVLAAPADATFPGTNGRLAFASFREETGRPNLFTVNPDGSDVMQLTSDTNLNRVPAWSPDGRRVAFTSAPTGDPSIFVMNADGTGRTALTDDAQSEVEPAWSPDGRRIAFVSNNDGGQHLWVMNADGSGQTKLTAGDVAPVRHPSWSPDGTRIAFAGTREHEILVINAGGGEPTRLTHTPDDFEIEPDWSPDGRKLVFASAAGGFDAALDIHTINPDGTGRVALLDDPSVDRDPVWSPDGTRIAFTRRDGDRVDIFTIGVDGTGLVRVTNDAVGAVDPAWQSIPANSPPDCSGVAPSPAVIDPPARDQLRLVTLSGATDPDGDVLGFRIDAVTQDEPVTGRGDDTAPDAALTDAGAGSDQVRLRAERNPRGNGRVYRVAYTVADATASCSGTVSVSVPRRLGEIAIDDGDAISVDSFTGEPV